MKVKNFFVYNNISIVWQLIECGLQIFHHCTLHLYKTKHYIFIREISSFNPLFIKPFYHFSPKILWVMTRCNKAHEGFIHFSRKRTCQIWYKSNFEKKHFLPDICWAICTENHGIFYPRQREKVICKSTSILRHRNKIGVTFQLSSWWSDDSISKFPIDSFGSHCFD